MRTAIASLGLQLALGFTQPARCAEPTIFDFGRGKPAPPSNTPSSQPLPPQAQTQPMRLPVPDAAAQASAEKRVWDVHKDDYQKTSAPQRAALASRLMEESHAGATAPVERFVLLREARDLAASAGDFALMERAVAEAAAHFELDAYDWRWAGLASLLSRNAATWARPATAAAPDPLRAAAAEAMLDFAADSMCHERYDLATQAAARAEELARNSNLSVLLARAQAQPGEIAQVRRQADAAKSARETLRAAPDDPSANLVAGSFACFVGGDWADGLPLLAKGSDPLLAALARAELAKPAKAQGQIELADAWWNFAEKLGDARGSTPKARIMAHAASLYRPALTSAPATARQRINQRLAAVASLPKPLQPADAAAGAPPTGALVASALLLVADDFVVEVYVNGRPVPSESRKLQADIYGAQIERVEVDLHDGDWIVFNVACNQLRWKGAHYFACAGLKGDANELVFASEAHSGRWLACDDLTDLARFVAEPDYLSDRKAQTIEKSWDPEGKRMRERVPNWSGEGIWGTSRGTWIKYLVKAD
jgi:hypothetical protein